jgi:hypothetical protein
MKRLFQVLLAVVMLIVIAHGMPLSFAAPSSPEVWVEAEGAVAFGQDTTLEAAQRGSLDAARRAAIEQAVGTFVRSSTVVRNFQLADDLIHSIVRGVIVEERILSRGLTETTGSEGALHRTRIKARVKSIPAERRGNFGVTVKLNRMVFADGDEAVIRITPTDDAYLYLFNVTHDEHITVLAPNRLEPETQLKAGAEYVFPSSTLIRQRVRLRTWLLPGMRKSVEKIKVIVTRRPVALLKGQVAEGVFREYDPSQTALLVDLMRVLAALDPADWAEDTAEYEVRKQ